MSVHERSHLRIIRRRDKEGWLVVGTAWGRPGQRIAVKHRASAEVIKLGVGSKGLPRASTWDRMVDIVLKIDSHLPADSKPSREDIFAILDLGLAAADAWRALLGVEAPAVSKSSDSIN